jgi:hypothetical protein
MMCIARIILSNSRPDISSDGIQMTANLTGEIDVRVRRWISSEYFDVQKGYRELVRKLLLQSTVGPEKWDLLTCLRRPSTCAACMPASAFSVASNALASAYQPEYCGNIYLLTMSV